MEQIWGSEVETGIVCKISFLKQSTKFCITHPLSGSLPGLLVLWCLDSGLLC